MSYLMKRYEIKKKKKEGNYRMNAEPNYVV